MPKNKKPRCVMVLTEGPSDRAALTDFFTEMFSRYDEDIEVFFPVLREESLSKTDGIEVNCNGDITSRTGIAPDNILPMLLKMFIHAELKKHPAYEYPSSVYEIIHLVDIDGVYLDDKRIKTADPGETRKLPYYDDQNHIIIAKDRNEIIKRNKRKRENLAKLVQTKKLRVTISKDENSAREKPYRVYYFSSNLDHVLFGKANNNPNNKVDDARKFGNDFFDEPLKLASYFINHPFATTASSYVDSWEELKNNHSVLNPCTNINLLVKDLLKKARITELPENDIRCRIYI